MSTIYQEFTYGDTASLRGNSSLFVTSPSGIVTQFPASVHRVQRFRVEELGTWSYEWGDGMKGEFVVVPAKTQSVPVPEPEPLKPPTPISKVPRRMAQVTVQTAGERFFAFF